MYVLDFFLLEQKYPFDSKRIDLSEYKYESTKYITAWVLDHFCFDIYFEVAQ